MHGNPSLAEAKSRPGGSGQVLVKVERVGWLKLFIRHKWHRTERSVKVGDMVWLADQNALRGQFRLGRDVATYPDKKGIVRDVDLKICMGLSGPHVSRVRRGTSDLPTTIVPHRNVRRLVVLIPVEDCLK